MVVTKLFAAKLMSNMHPDSSLAKSNNSSKFDIIWSHQWKKQINIFPASIIKHPEWQKDLRQVSTSSERPTLFPCPHRYARHTCKIIYNIQIQIGSLTSVVKNTENFAFFSQPTWWWNILLFSLRPCLVCPPDMPPSYHKWINPKIRQEKTLHMFSVSLTTTHTTAKVWTAQSSGELGTPIPLLGY